MQVSIRPKAAMARCGLDMLTRSTLSFTRASESSRDSCSDNSKRSMPRNTQWYTIEGVDSSLADTITPQSYKREYTRKNVRTEKPTQYTGIFIKQSYFIL